jgi:hypothetical protein
MKQIAFLTVAAEAKCKTPPEETPNVIHVEETLVVPFNASSECPPKKEQPPAAPSE